MPPQDCCEVVGVGGPVTLAALLEAMPCLGLSRVSRYGISVVKRLAKWFVAPEMPTYDGTTTVGCFPLRRISVCGSGLDGHNIHAIFWLCAWNAIRPTFIVRSTRFGFVSCAASSRSDSGFCSQNGKMATYQLGPQFC